MLSSLERRGDGVKRDKVGGVLEDEELSFVVALSDGECGRVSSCRDGRVPFLMSRPLSKFRCLCLQIGLDSPKFLVPGAVSGKCCE